jgi:LacI family transcriptional regulator
MSATLRDVALMAGVHTATAARALSESTQHKVAPNTRTKVEQAASKLGYLAHAAAATLRTGRSGFVGMLVPDLANPLFAPMLKSAEERLRTKGWTILIAQVEPKESDRLTALRTLISKRVDGLILATSQSNDPMLTLAAQQTIPTVLINRGLGDRRFPCVVNDDLESMRLSITHLKELGHQHFLHLSGPLNSSTGLARLEGFKRWAGSKQAVAETHYYTREAGYEAMRKHLLKSPTGCSQTAVVCGNDLIALGAIEAIRELGGQVPSDFSVVGHNDMPFMDLVSPALTTVHVHTDLMGQEAADVLIQRMSDPQGAVPASRLLHPDLVLRNSTAPPRSERIFKPRT